MSLEAAFTRCTEELSGRVRRDEPMSRHTSFRVGGPAGLFIVCETVRDIVTAFEVLGETDVPHAVVGKGTNLLVSDAGFDGAIIVLGRQFMRHAIDGECLTAGAAAMLAALVQDASANSLEGMSFAAGIPGTLGGALAMNAGTSDGWIGDVVESVTLFEPGRGLVRVRGDEITWGYRDSGLAKRGIIVEGVLRTRVGDARTIRADMERLFRHRKHSQPLGKPNAGSVFVNPPGDHAGRLIEECGLKGKRVGGALVSPVHANFIVNDGGATAQDIDQLIELIRTTVRNAYGIELKTEIRRLGRFAGDSTEA